MQQKIHDLLYLKDKTNIFLSVLLISAIFSIDTLKHFMENKIQSKIVFIAKSMLWSVLLYVAMMLVFNWDDVKAIAIGRNTIAVVANTDTMPTNPNSSTSITRHRGVFKSIVSIVRTISGFASISITQ
jgi:hypothetical protein